MSELLNMRVGRDGDWHLSGCPALIGKPPGECLCHTQDDAVSEAVEAYAQALLDGKPTGYTDGAPAQVEALVARLRALLRDVDAWLDKSNPLRVAIAAALTEDAHA